MSCSGEEWEEVIEELSSERVRMTIIPRGYMLCWIRHGDVVCQVKGSNNERFCIII